MRDKRKKIIVLGWKSKGGGKKNSRFFAKCGGVLGGVGEGIIRGKSMG